MFTHFLRTSPNTKHHEYIIIERVWCCKFNFSVLYVYLLISICSSFLHHTSFILISWPTFLLHTCIYSIYIVDNFCPSMLALFVHSTCLILHIFIFSFQWVQVCSLTYYINVSHLGPIKFTCTKNCAQIWGISIQQFSLCQKDFAKD